MEAASEADANNKKIELYEFIIRIGADIISW